jgi:hypothetical protein
VDAHAVVPPTTDRDIDPTVQRELDFRALRSSLRLALSHTRRLQVRDLEHRLVLEIAHVDAQLGALNEAA